MSIICFKLQLFGLYVAKLAVALILAGGSSALKCNSGVHTRSEPHLLLVGDPGIGKSQLLRRASKINPRSVLTTGVGSTSAGLTVAAFMVKLSNFEKTNFVDAVVYMFVHFAVFNRKMVSGTWKLELWCYLMAVYVV